MVHAGAMSVEIASFRDEDEPCLVLVSLACPSCLSSDVEWRLLDTADDPSVRCECRSCGNTRIVYLTHGQALRLALQEPWPLDLIPRAPALL
jgi:hypothetical protein